MDIAELERLVEIVQESNIRELTLKQGDSRITIRKSRQAAGPGGALVPVNGEFGDGYEVETEYGDDPHDVSEPQPGTVPVTAPLVGVFKHIKPIVGLGAHVKAGQTVGVIEAMKLINEVIAPADGVVTDVAVEDSMPVEYGQTLFELEPEA